MGIGSLLSHLQAHTALYVFFTLAYLGLAIFVYLLSTSFFKNTHVGLFALFAYLLFPQVLNGLFTFAPFFFIVQVAIVILYLILKEKRSLSDYVLGIILISYAIITHHANQIPLLGVFVFILILGCFVFLVHNKSVDLPKKIVNLGLVFLCIVPSAIYVLNNYKGTLTFLVNRAFFTPSTPVTPSAPGVDIQTSFMGLDISLFDLIQSWMGNFFVFVSVLLIIIGVVVLLWNGKKDPRYHFLGLFTVIFFILFIPYLDSYLPLVNEIYVYRWRGLLAPFFACVMAYGLFILIIGMQKFVMRRNISSILIVLLSLSLIISPSLLYAGNNEIFNNIGIEKHPADVSNEHFDTIEMVMFDTLSETLISDSAVGTEWDTGRYVTTYVSPSSTYVSFTPLFLEESNEKEVVNNYEYIIFREEHFLERGFKYVVGSHHEPIWPTDENIGRFNSNIRWHHCVYHNGEDTVYNI